MKKLGVNHTLGACYIGYITQAIVVNFAPLLFVTFVADYNISLTLIGAMITVNFGVQLLVDLASSLFVDKIGYRPCLFAAHGFACVGLLLLAFLPDLLPVPWAGLFIASAVYAVGGGLLEVLVSPVTEALPFEDKKAKMSLLHSFYSWGQMAVILLSTLFSQFSASGTGGYSPVSGRRVPLLNGVYFLFVPIYKLVEEGESQPVRQLLSTKKFWFFAILMVCAGSAEQAISQWASAFAESGLNISKTLGDILGPCAFALCMGVSRVLFSKFGERIPIRTALLIAGTGCIAGYAMCVFSPVSVLALVGCGVVGFFVGIMWPGVFSFAARECPKGGTAMFAFFALAGDVGCSLGPTAVGALSDTFGSISFGLGAARWFPVLAVAVIFFSKTGKRKQDDLPQNLK